MGKENIGISFGHGTVRDAQVATSRVEEGGTRYERDRCSPASPPVICNSQVGSGEMRDTGKI